MESIIAGVESNNITPAVANGDREAVRLALSPGRDINDYVYDGHRTSYYTLLYKAAMVRHVLLFIHRPLIRFILRISA